MFFQIKFAASLDGEQILTKIVAASPVGLTVP